MEWGLSALSILGMIKNDNVRDVFRIRGLSVVYICMANNLLFGLFAISFLCFIVNSLMLVEHCM